jgi:hypothetical protein
MSPFTARLLAWLRRAVAARQERRYAATFRRRPDLWQGVGQELEHGLWVPEPMQRAWEQVERERER